MLLQTLHCKIFTQIPVKLQTQVLEDQKIFALGQTTLTREKLVLL